MTFTVALFPLTAVVGRTWLLPLITRTEKVRNRVAMGRGTFPAIAVIMLGAWPSVELVSFRGFLKLLAKDSRPTLFASDTAVSIGNARSGTASRAWRNRFPEFPPEHGVHSVSAAHTQDEGPQPTRNSRGKR